MEAIKFNVYSDKYGLRQRCSARHSTLLYHTYERAYNPLIVHVHELTCGCQRYVGVHIHTCTQTHIHSYKQNIHTHTYIHTYIHTYMHACMHALTKTLTVTTSYLPTPARRRCLSATPYAANNFKKSSPVRVVMLTKRVGPTLRAKYLVWAMMTPHALRPS